MPRPNIEPLIKAKQSLIAAEIAEMHGDYEVAVSHLAIVALKAIEMQQAIIDSRRPITEMEGG